MRQDENDGGLYHGTDGATYTDADVDRLAAANVQVLVFSWAAPPAGGYPPGTKVVRFDDEPLTTCLTV
jgi:hypothetical protein